MFGSVRKTAGFNGDIEERVAQYLSQKFNEPASLFDVKLFRDIKYYQQGKTHIGDTLEIRLTESRADEKVMTMGLDAAKKFRTQRRSVGMFNAKFTV